MQRPSVAAQIVIALSVIAGHRVFPQTPASSSLGGVAIDSVTGQPLANQTLLLCWPGNQTTTTNLEGQFVFDVPSGTYRICPVYIPAHQRPLEVREGEAVRDVVVRVQTWPFRNANLDGRVVDEDGKPAPGVRVAFVVPGWAAGDRQLWSGAQTLIETDESGVFHIARMPLDHLALMTIWTRLFAPVIEVAVAAPTSPSITTLFAIGGQPPLTPLRTGTARWNQFVEVLPDVQRPAPRPADAARTYASQFLPDIGDGRPERFVDRAGLGPRAASGFRLQSVPAYRLSGQLTGGDVSLQGLTVALEDAHILPIRPFVPVAACLTDASGHFAFLGVPTGRYRIHVDTSPNGMDLGRSSGPPSNVLSASALVTVEGNVDGLAVPVKRGVALHGVIRFEGAAAPPPGNLLPLLVLHKVDGTPGSSPTMSASGSNFRSVPVVPGEYMMRSEWRIQASNWRLKSAVVPGRGDMMDLPVVLGDKDVGDIELTLTTAPMAEISGIVRNARGEFDSQGAVLIFPTDRRYWRHNMSGAPMSRISLFLPSRLGAYDFRTLPSGEYFIVAVPETDEVLNVQSPNPDLFARLESQATRVTLPEGAKVALDLTRR